MQQILIVEDSPTQAAKLQYFLEKHGYTTDVAEDGDEALQILRHSAPAVVISDVMMPGIGGFELCRRIKADPSLKNTAVILLTALTKAEDVIIGLTSGADNFLTKPYSESFLLSRVESVLQNKEIRRATLSEESDRIVFAGKEYRITARRHQIVDLLLSTFEHVIQKNKELEQANQDLQIAKKNLQDSEVRLQRQKADLARANRELESFSYSVSHDLRAPLRSIRSFSGFLLEDYTDCIDETGRDYLNRIMGGADRMSELIDDMLSLSRITRHEMVLQDVELHKAASDTITELRNEDPDREVHVEIQEDMIVRGDPRLLKIALTNMIGNAWKYTSKTPNAKIEFGSRTDSGRTVFYIRDNGAGFAQDKVENLFLPFRRLHSEKEFPGTGIGLPIVERVIRRHGGRIWAEAEVGVGATFYFTLG